MRKILSIQPDYDADTYMCIRLYSAEASISDFRILSDRASRSCTTFGLEKQPRDSIIGAAVKTGTSKDMRDKLVLGYTG